jgi:environmental stress-induced protein Ves
MKHFSKEHFTEMPWKNGGGMTLELFRRPGLRLSVATVDKDGPFSLFPGIDRILLILKGAGCKVNETLLTPETEPFYFPGEDEFFCTLLKGAIQDFNVMIDRRQGKAVVERCHTLMKISCDTDLLFLFYPDSLKLTLLENQETAQIEESCLLIKITYFKE